MLERVLADDASFADWPNSGRGASTLLPPALRALRSALRPGMLTLETGAGRTTVVFLLAGCLHTCVAEEQVSLDRVQAYCERVGVATGGLRGRVGGSDVVLPRRGTIPNPLDVVLIDGSTLPPPLPWIELHYAGERLRAGGTLVLGDHRAPAVAAVHAHLLGERAWRLIDVVARTAFFEKLL